ncbi:MULTISPECIES: hypothetical protein [Burkholderia]|uniref:hypothetical protein n=1 Tax=Burkholderia TaxID=32008 RepID=UPI0008419FE1|nr:MULTISPECIES: hypothetical protein [unclassified Burkholderia]AOK28380.1 hypothetical protein AQ611_02015 [Burkholderia sp. Bp7605]
MKGPFAFKSGMNGKGGAAMKIDGRADFTGDVTASGVSLVEHPHRTQREFARMSKSIRNDA